MSLQNIPAELRALPQWVCAGPDKLPLNPHTGQSADVTDASTWGTFEQCTQTGYPHIGFVLSVNDPYCIIDLDDPKTKKVDGVTVVNEDLAEVERLKERHTKLYAAFQSYSEKSQSGTGVHIIVRGRIPHGVRRHRTEAYSDSRFMICTGRVMRNLPISDQQTLLDALYDEMAGEFSGRAELVQVQGNLSDEGLYNMAATAANAEKFRKLWEGDWQGDYQSQSEADFAILSMLGFYSIDNEQVRRVFRLCALGKRDKAVRNDKYLNFALQKIRAKTPPPMVDLTQFFQNAAGLRIEPGIAQQTDSGTQSTDVGDPQHAPEAGGRGSEAIVQPDAAALPAEDVAFPPGFVGEVAEYIFASAIRPVREIALAAAVALTAGIVGRSYNISSSGLNQYIILLANTGTGKEGAATGIDALVTAAQVQCPMIHEFMGPGAFASGQALVRVLDANPCFVSIFGEFGLLLQQLNHPNANAAQIMLKKVLLDIYGKSGHDKTLASSVYSESDKNTKRIQAPNVTILGESTPDSFYSALDSASIEGGLVPRLTIFEYTGHRPALNENAFFPPDNVLVTKLATLAGIAVGAKQKRTCTPVQLDPEAVALSKGFEKHATDKINVEQGELTKQIWNRAHLKALKLMALIAVGVNPYQPIVTKSVATWAIKLVCRDIKKLLSKFDSGETGSGDVRMELDVRRAITAYLAMSRVDRRGYQVPEKMLDMPCIPIQFLRRRLRLLSSFRNDRRGATSAMDQTLRSLCDAEILIRLAPVTARENCGTNAAVYVKGPSWHN